MPGIDAERAQEPTLKDPDEYRACHIFWVPKEARWSILKATLSIRPLAKSSMTPCSPSSATTHPSRRSPKTTLTRASINSGSGQLIDLIWPILAWGQGEPHNRTSLDGSTNILSLFASAGRQEGGSIYTPRCVVRLLVGCSRHTKGGVRPMLRFWRNVRPVD